MRIQRVFYLVSLSTVPSQHRAEQNRSNSVRGWEEKLLSKRDAAEFDVSRSCFYGCCLGD